jgi:hypothetical protein
LSWQANNTPELLVDSCFGDTTANQAASKYP